MVKVYKSVLYKIVWDHREITIIADEDQYLYQIYARDNLDLYSLNKSLPIFVWNHEKSRKYSLPLSSTGKNDSERC